MKEAERSLPPSWDVVRLSEVADIASDVTKGRNFKSQKTVSAPYLRVANVQAGTLNLDEIKEIEVLPNDVKKFRLECGDVLMTEGGDPDKLGRGALWRGEVEDCIHQNHIFRVRVDRSRLLPEYLSTFLGSKEAQRYFLHAAKQTTGVATINKTQLGEFPITLPPLPEQHRIASILDKADTIRRKRQEALALADKFLRSAFLDMFGDPVTNPNGWEVVTVGDVTSNVRDGPHVSPKYSTSGVPFLSTRNIRPGRIVFDDLKFVTQKDYEELTRKFRAGRGDVLLTKGGTTGYAKVVDFDWPFTVWVHVAVLRPTSRIRPEFLEAALNSPNCYAQSQKYTHGITNKDLGLTRIRRITLTLPPISLQDEYCRIRNNSLVLSQKSEESLLEAERMFESLTQRAFRGEL